MSLLSVAPEVVSAASASLRNSALTLRTATAAAARETTQVAALAADEVSIAITTLFGRQGAEFLLVSQKAGAYYDDFVNLLDGAIERYVGAEAANASAMLSSALNASTQAMSGRPLVGTFAATLAAANPAETISSYTVGPFEIFTETVPAVLPLGLPQPTLAGTNNVGLRLNTPFGPVPIFSEGGTFAVWANPTNPALGMSGLGGHVRIGPFFDYDLFGTYPAGTYGYPDNFYISINGFRLTLLEALFGAIFPNSSLIG